MSKIKNSIFYIAIIGGAAMLMYWIIIQGGVQEAGKNIVLPEHDLSYWQTFLEALTHNLKHPLAILLAQIITIVIVARIFGWVCMKIKQPRCNWRNDCRNCFRTFVGRNVFS